MHPAWSKTEVEREFTTLYKELIDDKVKFYGYLDEQRMFFFALL